MAAIYQADIYCDDCADRIRTELRAEGKAPEDEECETTFDSDDFPKYAPDDEEADIPTHCGSGADCLNAEVLPSGDRVGALFGDLTMDGVQYVREHFLADPTSEVVQLWRAHFEAEGIDFDLSEEEPTEAELNAMDCDACASDEELQKQFPRVAKLLTNVARILRDCDDTIKDWQEGFLVGRARGAQPFSKGLSQMNYPTHPTSFVPRFLSPSDMPALANRWHLSKVHSGSRYERMVWTARTMAEELGLSSTAVYKDLDTWLELNR